MDDFEEGVSTEFWDFTVINGAGEASNKNTWHAAEMVIDHQLILRHGQDPEFEMESAEWQEPSSGQYNNVTLIGGSGFQPFERWMRSQDLVSMAEIVSRFLLA